MSAVCGLDKYNIPSSFTAFTRGMADGNDYKCAFVRIITFNQGKCPLREQTLAGLVLNSTRSTSTQFGGRVDPTNWEKSSCTLPSWSSRQSFPSLECASIPNKRNLSPARPSSCFVDLNCDAWSERTSLHHRVIDSQSTDARDLEKVLWTERSGRFVR